MKQNRIVITGGIASGKSTVSDYLRGLGFPVIDADRIARRALKKGNGPYYDVIREFGAEILLPSGEINREELGKVVFSDKMLREKLNQITHPWIFSEMQAELDALSNEKVVFLDIPLFYESGEWKDFPVWLVYAPEDLQMHRLMERNGYDEKEALARIRSQMPIEEKKQRSNRVIENIGTVRELQEKIDEELLRL